ncbi:hypothetical protein [Bacillus sp. FJAT-49736]|uniref:hypothetical protein n=1 Tax=Bacillus sp. FJAT-49736 TaxID=2833582 RepID=UPI001BC8DC22|nr:hypothetical protein [Bacillus sp. FJAT-49736]MBS4175851.1 hypothetical protein [Bacillus sp. FJAT-49736]
MDNRESLIKKHKKFFETPKPFPLKYRNGDQEIEMIQYKILKTESNWGFLFFPYNLEYKVLFDVFQKTMLMDDYLNVLFSVDKVYLNFATGENAYVMYRNQLLKEFDYELISEIITAINDWEKYMGNIKQAGQEKEKYDREIVKKGYFDDSILYHYSVLSGKSKINMLYQQEKQLQVHYLSKKANLDMQSKSKLMQEMYKEVIKPQTEIEIKRTINKTINYDKFKQMDEDSLVKFAENKNIDFVKNFFNEKHFKSVVRNPAVK